MTRLDKFRQAVGSAGVALANHRARVSDTQTLADMIQSPELRYSQNIYEIQKPYFERNSDYRVESGTPR